MQSDLPHTLYSYKKDDKGGISKADYDEAVKMNEASLRRSIERRKQRQQEHGYAIDEIFNGEADND